jgi:hypothetical protein
MTTSGFAARGARSVAFAVTSAALACAAHVVGSGGLPDIGTTILLTALLAFAGRALASWWPEPLTPLGAHRPLWVVTAPRDPAVVPDVLRRAHARRGPPFDS